MTDTNGIAVGAAVKIDPGIRNKGMIALAAMKHIASENFAMVIPAAQMFSPRQQSEQDQPAKQIEKKSVGISQFNHFSILPGQTKVRVVLFLRFIFATAASAA